MAEKPVPVLCSDPLKISCRKPASRWGMPVREVEPCASCRTRLARKRKKEERISK